MSLSDRIQRPWDTTLDTIGQLAIVGLKSRFNPFTADHVKALHSAILV